MFQSLLPLRVIAVKEEVRRTGCNLLWVLQYHSVPSILKHYTRCSACSKCLGDLVSDFVPGNCAVAITPEQQHRNRTIGNLVVLIMRIVFPQRKASKNSKIR